MNENAFQVAKRRELRRFHRAVDKAIEELLDTKYTETRSVEEYRQFASACALVKNLSRMVDLWADRAEPLFESEGERTKWEVYLSGLRKLGRDMPESYLFRFVLPMFGLEDLREKVVAYSGRWLDGLHSAHQCLGEVERYLRHLERGTEIAREYEADPGEDLPRLYASLKTWERQDDLDAYCRALGDFADTTVEVLIAGPVQLYLMLGPETFTLIFKSLTVGRLGDLAGNDEEYVELMSLHGFLQRLVGESTTLALLREVAARAARTYSESVREESIRLRAQLPTQDLKRAFVRRYESGVLFRREETA